MFRHSNKYVTTRTRKMNTTIEYNMARFHDNLLQDFDPFPVDLTNNREETYHNKNNAQRRKRAHKRLSNFFL